MLTLAQQKKISKITDDFMHMKPKAVNLLDYSISFISSSKSDYLQRELLIDLLNKNINNQRTFFFHIASHYYLNTNNGENPIEKLTEETIVSDYYREIKEIILSVRNNSLLEVTKDKIEEIMDKYLPKNFEEEQVKEEEKEEEVKEEEKEEEEVKEEEKEEEQEDGKNRRFGLRVGPMEKVNDLKVYPLQIKCPSDLKITGFLATFTTEISVNTNLSNLWTGLAVIGEKSIAHALNVNRGLVGTGNWQTVMYLNQRYQLYTSNIVNTKTNQYPCTLDIVDSNNKIITYHKNNTSNFIDESYNELEMILRNSKKSKSKKESKAKQNKKKKEN